MQFDPKIWNLDTDYHIFCQFLRNDSLFTQNDNGFKRYHFWKKFILRQLSAKMTNFGDIGQNSSVKGGGKSIVRKTNFTYFQRNSSKFMQKIMRLK